MVRFSLEVKKRDLVWVIPLAVVLVVGFVAAAEQWEIHGHNNSEIEGEKMAWVNFDGTSCVVNGNECAIRDSLNVEKVVRYSAGNYTIHWTLDTFSDDSYVYFGGAGKADCGSFVSCSYFLSPLSPDTISKDYARIGVYDSWAGRNLGDVETVGVMAFGKSDKSFQKHSLEELELPFIYWASFNGLSCPGGVCDIYSSNGVDSVSRNAAGRYTVNWASAFPSMGYPALINSIGEGNGVGYLMFPYYYGIENFIPESFQLLIFYYHSSIQDVSRVFAASFSENENTDYMIHGHSLEEIEGGNIAWVNFDGTSCSGGDCLIHGSYGVERVERVALGKYNVYWTSGFFDNSNYVASINAPWSFTTLLGPNPIQEDFVSVTTFHHDTTLLDYNPTSVVAIGN